MNSAAAGQPVAAEATPAKTTVERHGQELRASSQPQLEPNKHAKTSKSEATGAALACCCHHRPGWRSQNLTVARHVGPRPVLFLLAKRAVPPVALSPLRHSPHAVMRLALRCSWRVGSRRWVVRRVGVRARAFPAVVCFFPGVLDPRSLRPCLGKSTVRPRTECLTGRSIFRSVYLYCTSIQYTCTSGSGRDQWMRTSKASATACVAARGGVEAVGCLTCAAWSVLPATG
jgi:hypothetical protein